MYGIKSFETYAFIVSSFDQWFGECVMCQSEGNVNDGWHLSVFPAYISCIGKKSPVIEQANTAVICRLSSIPHISTLFEPSFAIVHDETGT